ncbi:1942_t:CDS:2, partial [Diversispora eburnea]
QTEMTGPQVSAYLLGFKDHYTSNKFVTIYLNSFETYLTSRYPIKNLLGSIHSDDLNTNSSENESNQEDNDECDLTNNEIFTITNSSKRINATTASDLMIGYDSWHEACNVFLQNSNLPARLQFVINDIELLHRCTEETMLDRCLRQIVHKNLEIAKIRRIERSVIGYDNTGDAEILLDQDDFNIDNLVSLDPYEIMHSRLHNTKFQKIITSRKRIEQTNNNMDSEENRISQPVSYQKRSTILQLTFQKISADLNDKQKKAFSLVYNHCKQNYTSNPNKPPQLLMYLGGAGGTGKSKVIKAICEYFNQIGQKQTLVLCALTGVAASNIGEYTLHSLCSFKFDNDSDSYNYNFSQESLKKTLQEHWANIEYLILDEVSMMGQKLITKLHAYIKETKHFQNDTIPFADLNIIFAGDFLQLPP